MEVRDANLAAKLIMEICHGSCKLAEILSVLLPGVFLSKLAIMAGYIMAGYNVARLRIAQ